MAEFLIPGLLALTACVALWRHENVYDAMTAGAADGLKLLISIVPALVVLLTAVYMLRASGALDALSRLLEPILGAVGIPPELLPLMLVRPFSGSAALALGADLMKTYGVNSLIGRTAAVMLGSTETTFYTLSVYFSAAGISRTRYVVPAALGADLMGFIGAAVFTRLLL